MRWGLPAFVFVASCGLVGCNSVLQAKLVHPELRSVSIVSLSPSTTELIGGSTVSQDLKGRTAADDYPMNVKSVPVVASVKPDFEAIKVINPSVILLDSQLYNASDLAKIKDLGAKTFVVDAMNVPDFEKQVFEIGDLIGAQTNQSDYVDRIEISRQSAMASKPTKPIKVAIILPGHGGAPMICGTKTFLGSIVTEDGGTVVGPPTDKFVPLNAETLTTENPDLIIVPTTDATASADVNSLLSDPNLKGTKAIQTKKIAAIDQDVALRRGARVDKLIDNIHKAFTIVGAN